MFTGGLAGSLIPARTLKDFRDLEDRLLFLSTKLDVTDKQMLTVTERIRELGRTTSFTANEVADGAAVLAQAGLNADQVMSTLGATLDLARGNAITLEQSGAILANTMTVFGIAGEKAGEVASQFTRAARLGTLDVLDLKESLKEVVGTLDNLNIDLPTSLALVTQLAQSSLKGTKAGTSLNTALLQLASKKDVLKNTLGIGIEDAQGNLRPIINILDDLLVRLGKMGDVARLATIQRIFNIRGGRAVQGLLRDLANVRLLTKDIRTAGNEAREAAIKMDSGFGGATRRTVNSLLSLSFTIGKINEQIAGPFLRVIPKLTAEIEKLAERNPRLVLTLSIIPPALLAIGAGGLVASFALNKLGGAIGLVGAGFQSAAGVINKQFTKSLVGVLRVKNKISKSVKAGDIGLSALLLTPQKKGGRGRGANKIVPTSFFGRVGNAKVPFIATLVSGFKLVLRLIDNLGGAIDRFANKSDAAIKRLFVSFTKLRVLNSGRGTGVISRLGENTLIGRTAELQARNQRKALETSLASQTAAYKKSIAVERAARASAKSLELQALDSIAALDRQTALQIRLKQVTLDLAKAQRVASSPANRLEGLIGRKGVAANRARVVELAAQRTAILAQIGSDAPDVEKLIGKAGIQSGLAESEKARRATLAANIRGTKKNLTAASVVEKAALATKLDAAGALDLKLQKRNAAKIRLAARRSAKIDATLFKGAGTIDRVFRTLSSGGLKLITSGFKLFGNAIIKTDYVRILFNIAKAGYSILKVFGAITKVTFLTLTTLSGWGNILTFLLIFGPHIKFIREAFERLGDGIATAFRKIIAIGTYLQPTFQLISSGIKSIIAGEGGLGLSQITESLSLMVSIIGNQLSDAWASFTLAISPAYDFMVKLVDVTLEFAKLIGSLVGGALGTGLTGIANTIAGSSGKGIGEILKDIFATEDIKLVLAGLAGFFIDLGKSLAATFQGMFNIVAETMLAIQTAIVGILQTLDGKFGLDFNSLVDDLSGRTSSQVTFSKDADGKIIATQPKIVETGLLGIRKAISQTNKLFNALPTKFNQALKPFTDAIELIFSKKTLGASSIAGLNLAATEGAVLNDTAQAAVDAAGKREQQRRLKPLGRFGGTSPSFPGSLDNPDKSVKSERDRLLEQRKELIFRANQQRSILQFNKPGSLSTSTDFNKFFRDAEVFDTAKGSLKDFKDKLKVNKADLTALRQQALPKQFIPQTVDIRDLVSLAVGDIQSTRFNKFKVGEVDPNRQQVDLLQQINAQLGPTANDSYLKKLVDKAAPLTFTK